MRNKVYRLYGFLVAVCLIVSMISPASAVPIIPDPGVSTDKSSICCGDEITAVVPVKNLRSVTKYLHIDIVIKNPSGSKIIDDSKPETIAAYASKTFQYTYTIPEPCTNFGTYTVEARVMEGSSLHDSDTTTFQVNDCNGGDEGCDTQLTFDTSKQDRPSMTYANNYFYVAYQSWETGESYNGDIFLKKFDSNWNEVKKEQITTHQYYQDSPSLVFANNKLYVALITNHQGATWDDYDVYIKEYDSNLNYISDSGRYLTTLESCQDMPSLFYTDEYFYLAYQSWETGSSYNGDIYIKKFDSSWNEIKKVRVTSETSVQDRPSVIYADGYFYIAYHSKETGSWDVFVKRLDANLNLQSWKEQVTSESSSESYPSINFVNDEYAIAYASNEGGTLGTYIKKYDSNWGFIEKVTVIDDGSAHEKRPSMVHALGDYQLAYVRYLEESEDFNIYSTPDECSSEETPSPEIIEVSYPSTCVNEGDSVPISVTVRNNGGASSEGYISVSFPNDEDVPESDVSGTGNGYNELFPKGYYPLWNNSGEQMTAIDPLVELFEANWGEGQQETISMEVKPNSGSDEIVFYVRAALKSDADGSYERDPPYSVDVDQQGWHVERHVIDVCSSQEVQFKGTVTDIIYCISVLTYVVQIDEVISDPTGSMNVGDTASVDVWWYSPAQVDSVEIGDGVEVYGSYAGYESGEHQVNLESSEHYLKKVEENKPDLTIEKVSWSPFPQSMEPFNFVVYISNIGTEDAKNFYIGYYIGEMYFEDYIEILSSGSTISKTYEITYNGCGDVFFEAIADVKGNVIEMDDQNNNKIYNIPISCKTPVLSKENLEIKNNFDEKTPEYIHGTLISSKDIAKVVFPYAFNPEEDAVYIDNTINLKFDNYQDIYKVIGILESEKSEFVFDELPFTNNGGGSYGVWFQISNPTSKSVDFISKLFHTLALLTRNSLPPFQFQTHSEHFYNVKVRSINAELYDGTIVAFEMDEYLPSFLESNTFPLCDGLGGCRADEVVALCPVNLLVVDEQGKKVGTEKKGTSYLEFHEIPNSIYSGDTEPEYIILLTNITNYSVYIQAVNVGEFNFTLTQSTDAKTTTVTYLDIPITETTVATVDVSEANPTYTMDIDDDGDGTPEDTIEPDSIEIITVCPYDHDGDGIVEDDIDDLIMATDAYLGFITGSEYDHDGDGIIEDDIDDLIMATDAYLGFITCE